ncbi:FKBP-type peptidyl-prolyl cis-trans isomerase [Pseudidiomarina taiwanensis]|uniref:Peptidyl-prolyl cis-trans isomerase n=1 Tax=Pseudidiomarina taiwanensis TaxID=337250 RepID=A0A432ZFT7_9GAMM|nr:FKBP-type peptidyl-prolyl cis-trans isomerase [Pseudidiomarina taiwanensis]RUO76828.1 peptidylprolyl isomerase [Pseudidiomarina taiwanensis]
MKYSVKPIALSLVAVALFGCSKPEPYPVLAEAPTDEKAKMAYALGASVGGFVGDNLDQQEEGGYEIDRQMVIAGFVDALKAEAKISEEEADQLLTQMQQEATSMRQETLGGKAKAEGEAYLAENAQKEGVVVTESGLQYEVLSEAPADAPKPVATDIVEVHYEGTLINGEVFDSSLQRGQSAVFPLNRVIKGWTEGVQLMGVGSKYRFVIPADLAYGDREVAGGAIPPSSTLIFEVELLDIKPQEAPAADVEVGSEGGQ